jgi:ABC-type transport system involved in cytochrome c biogenesis permease component
MAGVLSLGPSQGKEVFAALHLTVFCAIWILVPMVAADCLSRERREGTLGLLFLTPLKPFHITIAKTFTQSLRAFTLWLATVPIIVLPMLMGGVGRQETLLSILINTASFCWALGAGIWVSSRSTQFHRAIIATGIVTFIFFVAYLLLNVGLVLLAFAPGIRFDLPAALVETFIALGNVGNSWDSMLNQPQFPAWRWILVGVVAFSVVLLAVFTWLAARVLQATWQVDDSPGRWAGLRERFCTPIVFRNLYRRWLQWSLVSNPVGWLERRMWSSRIGKWAWLAILSALYGFVLADDSFLRHDFTEVQILLSAGLMGSAAFSAAASFRRERDNGVLTLLLVSPLRVRHIIGGRLRALWSQYLPAICLLFGAWIYLQTTFGKPRDGYWIVFFTSCFLSVPVIGLYCSLWRQTFFAALLWTGLCGFVFPLGVSLLLVPRSHSLESAPALLLFIAFGQVSIAGGALALLFRNLSQRAFKLPAT